MAVVAAGLLDIDTGWAAREVAVDLIAAATAALPRLDDADDAEAIHAFRVATRRSRSWLRAFRDWIGSDELRREERRLRELAHESNELRDMEVQVELLRRLGETLPARSRSALRPALSSIEARMSVAAPEVRRVIRRRFPRIESRLLRALGRAELEIDPETRNERKLRVVLATLVESQAAAQRDALAELSSNRDAATVHRARIAGKRLRYLLEPFAAAIPVAAVLSELKSLQDSLGEAHDGQVLQASLSGFDAGTASSRKAVTLAIAAIGRRGEEVVDSVFERLGGAAVPALSTAVTDVVASLRAPVTVEIERKYLLRALPPGVAGAPMDTIDQGYIPGREIAERLRRSKRGRTSRYFRTIKTGRGIARSETEEEIDAALFRKLWPATEGKRVAKRRFHVSHGEHTWEVDQFTDRELVLAEVELSSEGEPVEIPDWLSPWMVREVTGEDEFVNLNLAR